MVRRPIPLLHAWRDDSIFSVPLHEYNGGLPPNESENRYWKNANAVASFS
ncbi:MAG: hypothetical protein ACR5LG_11000 [Sodalis sp. (in: enterobacteria)]